jgi:hypothetical protein
MKHTLLFLAFLCLTFSSIAQDLEGWHIGATVQPYNYWLYNKDDIRADPKYKVFISPKLGKFNGFATGFVATYYKSDRFAIRSELTYSRQTQYYTRLFLANQSYKEFRSLDYVKAPITARLILSPSQRGSMYLDGGIQISIQSRYTSERHYIDTLFKKTFDEYTVNKDWYGKSTLTEDYGGHTDLLFRRFQLGTLIEAGWLFSISDLWHINLGVRGEYDLIKAERKYAVGNDGTSGNYWNKNTVPTIPINRLSFSNNIRLGLNFSINYKLN